MTEASWNILRALLCGLVIGWLLGRERYKGRV